jgi:hypothetical protein
MVAASSALGQTGIEISRGVAERNTAFTIGGAAVGFTTVDVFDLLSMRSGNIKDINDFLTVGRRWSPSILGLRALGNGKHAQPNLAPPM